MSTNKGGEITTHAEVEKADFADILRDYQGTARAS